MGDFKVEQTNIEQKMMGLLTELHKLAANPTAPKSKSAEFVKVESYLEPSAEYDSLMGEVLMDAVLGSSFASAASGLSWDQLASAASEFLQERSQAKPKAKPVLGRKLVISRSFNMGSVDPADMEAYLRDLPRRMGIERYLADAQRKLYALKKHERLAMAA